MIPLGISLGYKLTNYLYFPRLLGHYHIQNHMKAEAGVDIMTLIKVLLGASPSSPC